MNRDERRKLGRQTVELLEQGFYRVGEVRAEFARELERSVASTVEYTNRDPSPDFERKGARHTTFAVRNETTLCAARRLAQSHDVAVLNFASAKNPGGGFLNGSQAQEESLAMSSGLYPCLVDREMYRYHRPTRGGMYTPWAIYSPDVPVIRDSDGSLLAEPYGVSFITSPAVNAGVVLSRAPDREEEVRDQMEIRIDKVLAIAAHHGHDAVVLGAWGCGVFGNDPGQVAQLFGEALSDRFDGVFDHVAFAILDWSDERRYIAPFERCFSPPD